MSGIDLIAQERQRQLTEEKWTPEHDDTHTLGELAAAAACYALHGTKWRDSSALVGGGLIRDILWPWGADWWKPTPYRFEQGGHLVPEQRVPTLANDLRIRDLSKSGALVAAEMDRLQRSNEQMLRNRRNRGYNPLT